MRFEKLSEKLKEISPSVFTLQERYRTWGEIVQRKEEVHGWEIENIKLKEAIRRIISKKERREVTITNIVITPDRYFSPMVIEYRYMKDRETEYNLISLVGLLGYCAEKLEKQKY